MFSKSFLSTLSIILIGIICSESYALDRTNFIRNGNAEVRMTIEDSSNIPDSLNASIIFLPLFNLPFESLTMKMNQNGNEFHLSVPLYVNKALAGITIESPTRRHAVGMIELSQDSVLKISGQFNPDGTLILFKSNNSGVNEYDLGPTTSNKSIEISDIIYRFVSYRMGTDDREPIILPQDYTDWNIITAKLDSLYDVQLNYALNGRTIPNIVKDWLTNNLKYFFAANWRFNYVERAQRTFKISTPVDTPPLEYYRFLNDLDFSSNFLNHTPIFGPYYLLTKLISQLPINICPIGYSDIDIWQEKLIEQISPIIPSPEPLLVNLLTMTSYIQQIENQNQPLSQIQIQNITKVFNRNISSIILSLNDSLKSDLEKPYSINNLIGKNFTLDKILKEYPDTPIIVDLWNTWCSPCINSHKEIKSSQRNNHTANGIITLYICDESSPFDAWQRLSSEIGGTHIRISSTDMESLLMQYELSAFPSYLFFDKNHALIVKLTGFPGIESYIRYMELLKRP